MTLLTDPLAQELLIGSLIAALLILLGMGLGLAIAAAQAGRNNP